MPIIFRGDDKFAYRDPTCYYFGGLYHLFFTVSEKDGGYMYNRVGHSVSEDLLHFSEPMPSPKPTATHLSPLPLPMISKNTSSKRKVDATFGKTEKDLQIIKNASKYGKDRK